jgi:hypothetical protein
MYQKTFYEKFVVGVLIGLALVMLFITSITFLGSYTLLFFINIRKYLWNY